MPSAWPSKATGRSASAAHKTSAASHPEHRGIPGRQPGEGLTGLREYLRQRRQDESSRQPLPQALGYALGRGLLLSDEKLVASMKMSLAADGYKIQNAVEAIVLSKQFQYQRGNGM
jgi:hypothetical protein